MPAFAATAARYIAAHAKQYEPADPYYEIITDEAGHQKRRKRDIPAGLSKRDAKALRKIRRRAHYLDKGINLCGFRVGWTFFIGIIPMVGDVTDAALNYVLVVKPARKLDLPTTITSQMMFNNAISAGVGLVPLVGDIGLAVWKANWRNANLLEEFLAQRGAENLAVAAQGQAVVDADVVYQALALDADGILGNVDVVPAHPAAGKPGKKKRGWNPFASHEDAEADADVADTNKAQQEQVATAVKPASTAAAPRR
ncbi:uncharacterized protein CcaverHIS019_0403180 [Cutaneotrichosporon cavernicola]|uniref:Uncharacterized protein n=1 Tax=Cutaneotrichosporon cavernicola TaxID=279322 RepID=A0AA48L3Y7_9TREE|nr:uncharacterized protein CcaverHIS019_0403180 [Cutaneotrichosporon cavernicola]BEI91498.1 hypothetical protein CcaverHIS019_0403180 [Cutaneotrichosporon cavernicola]BEI99273.1 hypothetical protein CcaverHIS631_0403160 [Cutaneotrichosporon cavernicola]